MKGNVINLNTLHLNSVRLNGIGKVQSVSLKGGSTEDPVFPPVEPPVEPEPIPTYTLSASVTNGMVSARRNGSAVTLPFTANEGDTIVLSVTPNDGYTFEGWADGNTDNPRSITMTADVVLSAQCVEVVVPPSKDYIQFEDAEVERVLMSKGVSSDGVGITKDDAAAVTSIGAWFKNNTLITSFDELILFKNVTALSGDAFYGCSNLRTIDLSNIREFISTRQFRGCTNLVGDISGDFTMLPSQVFLGTAINSVTLPLVTSIGASAFQSCTSLKSVMLGDKLTEIATDAFYQCSALESFIIRAVVPPTLGNARGIGGACPIYVPDASLEAYKGATNWNTYADRIHPLSEIEGSPYIQFEDAEVERVLMANGVSSDGIGITKDDAAAVTTIGTWFKGNTAMTSFDELKYFINVKAISGFAFAGCENLQRVNCENIETMDAQVFNNSGIVELILPKITDLPNSGLVGMKKVTKVVIGASCTKIDPNNIWSWNDKGKVAFILEGTTPPTVSTGNNQPSWYGVTFYVPNDSVDTYKSANGWSSWADKIKPLSELNA